MIDDLEDSKAGSGSLSLEYFLLLFACCVLTVAVIAVTRS